MNYFLKIKFGVWVVIILTVINLATLGTIIYKNYREKCRIEKSEDHEKQGRKDHSKTFMQRELGLTDQQAKDFEQMKWEFFKSSKILFDSLEQSRINLVKELISFNGDTSKIFETTDQAGRIYTRIKRNTVVHILSLRSKCTPEQITRLDTLYYRIIRPEGPIRHNRRDSDKIKK